MNNDYYNNNMSNNNDSMSNNSTSPPQLNEILTTILSWDDSQFDASLLGVPEDAVLFSTPSEGSHTPYFNPHNHFDIFQAIGSMTLGESSTSVYFTNDTPSTTEYSTAMVPVLEHEYCSNCPSMSPQDLLQPMPPQEWQTDASSPHSNIEYRTPSQSPFSASSSFSAGCSERSTSSPPPVNSRKKRHHCDQCKSSFGRIQDLNRHLATIHSDRRDFVCEFCNKEFSRRDSLKRHQKTEKRQK
jgi:hypothetical protein